MRSRLYKNNIIFFNFFICSFLISGCASFEVKTTPEKAEIYEGDKKIGVTPYQFDQFSGERKFTLKKPGYVEKA